MLTDVNATFKQHSTRDALLADGFHSRTGNGVTSFEVRVSQGETAIVCCFVSALAFRVNNYDCDLKQQQQQLTGVTFYLTFVRRTCTPARCICAHICDSRGRCRQTIAEWWYSPHLDFRTHLLIVVI